MAIGYGYGTNTSLVGLDFSFDYTERESVLHALDTLIKKGGGKVNDKVTEQREINEALKAEVSRRRVEKGIADGLAAIAGYGEDIYPNETVVSFRKTYASKPDQSFSYAAIKADGRWYVTGLRMNNCALTWDEFVLVLVSDVPATAFTVLTPYLMEIDPPVEVPAEVPATVVEYSAA